MSNISDRIRKERKRLGLSQEALGALGGVKKLAQFNYESGAREPDTAYLEAISRAGVDLGYVLTGEPGELSHKALWHVLMVIQEFLGLTAYDKELEAACRLAYEEGKIFWDGGINENKADDAILALLKKSPVLLLDQWQFEELIEKLEFVLETTKRHLPSPTKARAIMHLYKAVKSSGRRVDLQMVEAAIEAST